MAYWVFSYEINKEEALVGDNPYETFMELYNSKTPRVILGEGEVEFQMDSSYSNTYSAIKLAEEFYPKHGRVTKAVFVGNIDKLNSLCQMVAG